MGSRRYRLKNILANHVDAPFDPYRREFIESIASALYERSERLWEWPETVQDFYACYDINYQVGNGGFQQAAYNVPELLPAAQRAFDRMGRKQAAELCRRAVAMLPTELHQHLKKGLWDRASIERIFEHFSDSEMEPLNDNIPDEFWADDALQDLVQRHRADFESVD